MPDSVRPRRPLYCPQTRGSPASVRLLLALIFWRSRRRTSSSSEYQGECPALGSHGAQARELSRRLRHGPSRVGCRSGSSVGAEDTSLHPVWGGLGVKCANRLLHIRDDSLPSRGCSCSATHRALRIESPGNEIERGRHEQDIARDTRAPRHISRGRFCSTPLMQKTKSSVRTQHPPSAPVRARTPTPTSRTRSVHGSGGPRTRAALARPPWPQFGLRLRLEQHTVGGGGQRSRSTIAPCSLHPPSAA
jgi:hypothetical protein